MIENNEVISQGAVKAKQEIPLRIMQSRKLRKMFGIKLTPKRVEKRPGRNEKCPCESGKKYKHCCLGKFNFEVNE